MVRLTFQTIEYQT